LRNAAAPALLAAALLPGGAQAAVTIGQAPPAPGSIATCPGPSTWVQRDVSSGPDYAVPAGGGVITSWQTATPNVPNLNAALLVVDLTPPQTVTVELQTRTKQLTADAVNSFPVRIPVTAGERIGIYDNGPGSGPCFVAGFPAGNNAPNSAQHQFEGSTVTYAGALAFGRVNVSAVVEPDADGDGFGDDSQDLCPTDATRQGDCGAPVVGISKKPKAKSKSKKATFTFAAGESATFECALDSAGFKPCHSPKKLKGLESGRHKFRVRGLDSAGNLGSPTVARWRVKG
jgi:hypothetical protein